MNTIHTSIVFVSNFQWKIFQMDVKNALLNEDHMISPPSVSHKSSEVCKLQKALYGLKQAPRTWFQKFFTVIVSLGFIVSHYDFALFVRKTNARHIFLSLCIDDMIITGDDFDGIASLKTALSHRFSTKDLDVRHYFLGIEVASFSKGYILSKSNYIVDLFGVFGLLTTRLLILLLRQVFDFPHRMVLL